MECLSFLFAHVSESFLKRLYSLSKSRKCNKFIIEMYFRSCLCSDVTEILDIVNLFALKVPQIFGRKICFLPEMSVVGKEYTLVTPLTKS